MRPVENRESYFDIFKALMMFSVILGHCIETGLIADKNTLSVATTYVFLYFFHMPCFVFLFGYFSKSTAKSSRKNLSRIIMFFILYAVCKSFYYGGFKLINGDFPAWKHSDYWAEDAVPWFMLSAALLSASLWIARKIPQYVLLPITYMLGILCGNVGVIGAKFTLCRTLIYLPIFLTGYYFPKCFFEYLLEKKRVLLWGGSAIILITVWGITWLCITENPSFYTKIMPILYCNNNFAMLSVSSIEGILIRICHYVFSLLISASVAMVVMGINYYYKGKLLLRMGRNTLAVYLVHYPILLLFVRILGQGVNTIIALVILLLIQIFWSLDFWEKGIRFIQKSVDKYLIVVCKLD